MDTGCKIGRFKPKGSKEWLTVLDNRRDYYSLAIRLGNYASITIQYFEKDDGYLRNDTCIYLLDQAKEEIMQKGVYNLKREILD